MLSGTEYPLGQSQSAARPVRNSTARHKVGLPEVTVLGLGMLAITQMDRGTRLLLRLWSELFCCPQWGHQEHQQWDRFNDWKQCQKEIIAQQNLHAFSGPEHIYKPMCLLKRQLCCVTSTGNSREEAESICVCFSAIQMSTQSTSGAALLLICRIWLFFFFFCNQRRKNK